MNIQPGRRMHGCQCGRVDPTLRQAVRQGGEFPSAAHEGDIARPARQRRAQGCLVTLALRGHHDKALRRAAGIDPVDGPFADFKNPDAYREECQRSMILGCVGKWAIHPSQIDIALDVYSPKAEDIVRARKLEKAYAEAEAAGLGAINVDGIMVDVASIRILRNTILNKADLYGL